MKLTFKSFIEDEDNYKISDQLEGNCPLSGQHGITNLL